MGYQILCAICLLSGQVVIMAPKDNICFSCPECENEVWPKDDNFVKKFRKMTENNNVYRSCSLPEGVKVHGGNDPVGQIGTARMGKESISKLNFLLFRDK